MRGAKKKKKQRQHQSNTDQTKSESTRNVVKKADQSGEHSKNNAEKESLSFFFFNATNNTERICVHNKATKVCVKFVFHDRKKS